MNQGGIKFFAMALLILNSSSSWATFIVEGKPVVVDAQKSSVTAPSELGITKAKKDFPSICRRQETTEVKSVTIKTVPEYYYRPFPDGEKLIYSDKDEGNKLLNLRDQTVTGVFGKVDAFPTPDGKYLFIANKRKRLTFVKSDNPQMVLKSDPMMQGYYQSVGIYKDSKGEKTYRTIIDLSGQGLRIKDYTERDLEGPYGVPLVEPAILCPNIKYLSLPMLSKDGQLLSVVNGETQSTMIYKLTKNGNTYECSDPFDLRVVSGKADFSFDGKKVAFFHMDVASFERDQDYGEWIEHPYANMVANIYEADLETRKVKQITHYRDTNALYPTYTQKNQILVRRYNPVGADFVVLDPKKIKDSLPIDKIPKLNECQNWPREFFASYLLGSLFVKFCTDPESIWNEQGIILLAQDLEKKQCQDLVKKWKDEESLKDLSFLKLNHFPKEAKTEIFKELTADDLAAVCPH